MDQKITIEISKNDYMQTTKNLKNSKELLTYARVLVYVAETINVILSKLVWTFINIEFLQCIFKSSKILGMFHIIRNQFPNLWC